MKPFILNIAGREFQATEPVVMTVLNITPDSFYAGSRVNSEMDLHNRLLAIDDESMGLPLILDIGGCSTRPGAAQVAEKEELKRLTWALRIIKNSIQGTAAISIDTYRASIVERLYDLFGGFIINDISGGALNPAGPAEMFEVAARHSLPYILGHTRGNPEMMAQNAKYHDITAEITAYFIQKIVELRAAGVADIILDPCFGFAKTQAQNFELLKNYPKLNELNFPVVAALSRKSMIYKTLGVSAEESLEGTMALNWEALRGGAAILRVHDTRQAAQCVRLFTEYNKH